MSDLPEFVTQAEIEEERKRRQEEWEKVRQPGQPKEAPDPDYDPRPLYVRLKEQRDKEQMEYEEAHRFKHIVRELDSEELSFLNFVDHLKAEEEKKIRDEETELIKEVNETMVSSGLEVPPMITLPTPLLSTTTKPIAKPKTSCSKQAQLIAGAIKRKHYASEATTSSASTSSASTTKRQKTSGSYKFKDYRIFDGSDDQMVPFPDPGNRDDSRGHVTAEAKESIPKNSAAMICGIRPSAMQVVARLPGIDGNYSRSDSSCSSDSDSDEYEFLNYQSMELAAIRRVNGGGGGGSSVGGGGSETSSTQTAVSSQLSFADSETT
ncbi:unnamed protein product [Soboliphyme baturini]|uniref:Nefa_Nip30_N domain-containing protein n=1 Tax=Soboliphyme baturini TaxID=241478 RepID=A0A183ID42_9BILA|nr:unnamed protein product [Soboliphyme baturini]